MDLCHLDCLSVCLRSSLTGQEALENMGPLNLTAHALASPSTEGQSGVFSSNRVVALNKTECCYKSSRNTDAKNKKKHLPDKLNRLFEHVFPTERKESSSRIKAQHSADIKSFMATSTSPFFRGHTAMHLFKAAGHDCRNYLPRYRTYVMQL